MHAVKKTYQLRASATKNEQKTKKAYHEKI